MKTKNVSGNEISNYNHRDQIMNEFERTLVCVVQKYGIESAKRLFEHSIERLENKVKDWDAKYVN